MKPIQLYLGVWSVAVVFLAAQCFSIVLDIFADPKVVWQSRLAASNIEYALALFFFIFNALWQAVAVDDFSKRTSRHLLTLYRAVIFPLFIAVSIVVLIPFGFRLQMDVTFGHWLIAGLWIFVAGDPAGRVVKDLSESDWFQEKIFKSDGQSESFFYRGLRGGAGVLLLHFAVLIIFVVGVFRDS